MKKINNLTKQLQKINSYNFPIQDIEHTSISRFIKHKYLIRKRRNILKHLHKIEVEKRAANFLYDVNVKGWYNNQQISCRKYCKLQEKAEYKRDKTLYKLGIFECKPLHPQTKKFKTFLNSNLFFSKLKNNYNSLVFGIIPKLINNILVKITSTSIKLIHNVKSDVSQFINSIKRNGNVLYLKNIVQQATAQINRQTNPSSSSSNYCPDELAKTFRESIKYIPSTSNVNTFAQSNKNSNLNIQAERDMRKKKIIHTRTKNKFPADITL